MRSHLGRGLRAVMMTPASHRAAMSPRMPSSLGVIFLWTAVANGGGAADTVVPFPCSSSYSSSSSEDECPDVPLPQHALEFYINGTWLPPTDPANANNTLDVINPSFGLPISRISLGTASDAEIAIRAATEALPSWSQSSIAERRLYVERLLTIYRRRRGEMASLISAEMGSPIDQAAGAQAGSGVHNIRQFLSALEYFEMERLIPGAKADGPSNTVIRYEPVGVVALITPWNWPMSQVTLKVIPALLVGCTCVLKPSEMAPLSSLLFAEMIHEAGFPPGVFNLVNGDGDGVGAYLSSHDDVDMVSFTGSTRAGRLITQAAASNFKRVSLELGGKGANLIFDDVGDGLEDVVRAGVWGCFDNSGQNCNAPTRMLVERGSYDEAVRIATETALDAGALVRPAHLPGDHYGPVSSGVLFERVQGYIRSGIDQEAKLVAGGLGRPEGTNTHGFFVKPTLFVDVMPNMTIAREEIFGPVLCMMPFDSEEEAVEIANGTPYGLTNYVHTKDRERRRRLARSLKSGMIEMNGIEADRGAPFAAMKASGNGREGGIWGLEEYTVIKVVSGVD